jgi:tRNA(Phe) wybutosine-synthesizing methylase Tyw3
MSPEEINVLSERIKKGLILSFERLLEQTKKEDGELVFSKKGKIVHIKARDIQ